MGSSWALEVWLGRFRGVLEASRDVSCNNRKKSDNKMFKKCIPKLLTNQSKICLKSSKNRSKSSTDRPGCSQDPPESSESLPRALQKRPKSAQERPRSAQERPKSRSRAPRDAPESLGGTILTFEGDQSRDSFEQRVRIDFRSNFASRAQAWTCEKPIKTSVFHRFSLGFYRCS